MATNISDYEDEISSLEVSVENLVATNIRPSTSTQRINTFRPCFFFGQRIPTIHRPCLYLHLLIVSLQFFFYFNTKQILQVTLEKTFNSLFHHEFAYPLIGASSYLLIPFIVYFCDLKLIRRYLLVVGTLIMAFVAGCCIVIVLSLEIFENPKLIDVSDSNNTMNGVNETVFGVEYSLTVLSLVLFEISFSLSYPFSIAFGLDLLHGTPLETLLLYFPLFYIAKNIGGALAYLQYVRWLKSSFYIHASIANVILLIALILSIIGRVFGYFKDSPIASNNFSFLKGLKVLISAFKLKFCSKKKADFQLLMLYAARKKGYTEAKSLVDKTLAMTKINFIFVILIPLLCSYQIVYQLFPEQSNPLNFLPLPVTEDKNSKYYCHPQSFFLSYFLINPLTIVFFGLLIEYFFYDTVFALRNDIPCWTRCIPQKLSLIRETCLPSLRERLHKHFTLVDPILKRVFWGLPFGLISALCAISVEICRIKFPARVNCTENSVFLTSMVPLVAQIPQYFFSGILEAISIIGLLQYVYFLCSNHFHNSLKGFFFSLFFFYYGLAGVLSNASNFAFDFLCYIHCDDNFNQTVSMNFFFNSTTQPWCLVYNSKCKSGIQENTWAIWVIVIGLYSIMIPMFYIFSHYNHWKRVREERLFEQEVSHDYL